MGQNNEEAENIRCACCKIADLRTALGVACEECDSTVCRPCGENLRCHQCAGVSCSVVDDASELVAGLVAPSSVENAPVGLPPPLPPVDSAPERLRHSRGRSNAVDDIFIEPTPEDRVKKHPPPVLNLKVVSSCATHTKSHRRARSDFGCARQATAEKLKSRTSFTEAGDNSMGGNTRNSASDAQYEPTLTPEVVRSGILRKRGGVSKKWKVIYVTLMSDSMLHYYKYDKKLGRGEKCLGSLYLKGANYSLIKGYLEGGIKMKTISGNLLFLQGIEKNGGFEYWARDFRTHTDMVPHAAVLTAAVKGASFSDEIVKGNPISEAFLISWALRYSGSGIKGRPLSQYSGGSHLGASSGASTGQGSSEQISQEDHSSGGPEPSDRPRTPLKGQQNVEVEQGPLCLIKVTSNEGNVTFGYVMARPDGHFSPYMVDPDDSASATAFIFRQWTKTIPKKRGNDVVIHAFRSVKTGKFMSRAFTSDKVRSTPKFGDQESIAILGNHWSMYRNGIVEPVPVYLRLTDPRKLLCTGLKGEDKFAFHIEEVGDEQNDSTLEDFADPLDRSSCLSPETAKTPVFRKTKKKRKYFGINSRTDVPLDSMSKASALQSLWDDLARFLVSQKMRNIKELPYTIDVAGDETACTLVCPAFTSAEKTIQKIEVLKRFNSRKLPHLITVVGTSGEVKKFIFKEDDDISMDVAVMRLLAMANRAFESKHCFANIRTYSVVACEKLTGFCECVPGDTMLRFDAEKMNDSLGFNVEKWKLFFASILAITVTTAAFDITDRHHANALFSPEHGDVSIIDLSASLGLKTAMDSALNMNPIYFPQKFHRVRYHFLERRRNRDFSSNCEGNMPDFSDSFVFEEQAMRAYYAIYNDPHTKAYAEQFKYVMPTPFKFHKFLVDRMEEGTVQRKEALRNMIVSKMEASDTVNNVISSLASTFSSN